MSNISVQDLCKTYPGQPPVKALDRIDLEVPPGEFVALLGPSGCGKSTLLNLIAGFESPTSGVLQVEQKAVLAPGPDRGVVFQEAALFPWLTVWENVVFGPKVQGLPKAEYEERANEMISIVGLQDFKNHLPVQLSGGMRQRVGIARILTLGSRVLLMDEPFGALDALTRAKLQDELLAIVANTQSTVVMVTHDVDEAVLLSDKIVMMTNGPAATIGEVLQVDLPRPRSRVELSDDPRYLSYRKAVIDFLYTRQAHVEKV